MDKKTMLHCLRNPYGIAKIELRKARLQAADELEKFYLLKQQLEDIRLLMSNSKDSLKIKTVCSYCSITPMYV